MSIWLISLLFGSVYAVNNGVGRTPPLGWNSWNKFQCDIDEDLIKATADKIVELGLDLVGYIYVNVDDCWMAKKRVGGH